MSSPNATVAAKSAIDAPVNRPPSVRKDTPVMFRRNVTGFGSGIVCIEYLRGLRERPQPLAACHRAELRRGIRPCRTTACASCPIML